jgi:hypothetical protein
MIQFLFYFFDVTSLVTLNCFSANVSSFGQYAGSLIDFTFLLKIILEFIHN